jgi:group I intron endonuclease
MNIYTIYKATNTINGKVYVGFDSKWPKRQKEHTTLFMHYNTVFSKAIEKYGAEAFSWEIIYQSKEKEHTLSEMETFFIKKFNSHIDNKMGYNMTYGGEGSLGCKRSEDQKKKMSEKHKNRVFSEEWKRKISESKKGQKSWNKDKKIGPMSEDQKHKISKALVGNQYAKGMTHSEETKLKMSQSNKGKNKGKKRTAEQRKIISESKKGNIPWNKGVTHSKETSKKISEANKSYNINKLQNKTIDCVYLPIIFL